ncbi:hypothetical protein B0H13DRAFT_2477636 [Mycena leptocephala]|nr:hypothetical protein B0H13DRAFT_2477636 [Mycena leptocephala]
MPAMSGHAGAVLSVSCARGVETPSAMRAGAVLLVRDDGKYMSGGGMEQGSGNAPQISVKIPSLALQHRTICTAPIPATVPPAVINPTPNQVCGTRPFSARTSSSFVFAPTTQHRHGELAPRGGLQFVALPHLGGLEIYSMHICTNSRGLQRSCISALLRRVRDPRTTITSRSVAPAYLVVLKDMWDALSPEEKSDWDSQAEDEASDVELYGYENRRNQREFSTSIHLAFRSLCQGGLFGDAEMLLFYGFRDTKNGELLAGTQVSFAPIMPAKLPSHSVHGIVFTDTLIMIKLIDNCLHIQVTLPTICTLKT